jgi:hypothetical protein
MAWSNSKIFSAYLTDVLNNTTAIDLDTDALIEAALFDNTITPSQTVASASSAYATGVWAAGGVSDATGWPALGRPLASKTSVFSTNVYTFDAADTVSVNSTTTLVNAFGTLIYDHSIASPVAGFRSRTCALAVPVPPVVIVPRTVPVVVCAVALVPAKIANARNVNASARVNRFQLNSSLFMTRLQLLWCCKRRWPFTIEKASDSACASGAEYRWWAR